MNSAAWILRWIHIYEYIWIQQPEFLDEFIYMNSDVWFHNIFYDHEFRSEFISWIQIRFHDHEFICYISWPMNSDMNSCILLWNHKWNQGAKVPDECHNSIPPPAGLLRKPVRCQLSVNRYQLVSTQYQDGYLFQVKKVTFWSESLRKLASWLSVVQI